jgi:hypothetical protein
MRRRAYQFMRSAGSARAAATLLLAGFCGVSEPATAQVIQGPPGERQYCATYDDGSGIDCSFATFQECLAAVSGVGGSCNQNVRLPSGPQLFPNVPRRERLFPDPLWSPPAQDPMPPPPDE